VGLPPPLPNAPPPPPLASPRKNSPRDAQQISPRPSPREHVQPSIQQSAAEEDVTAASDSTEEQPANEDIADDVDIEEVTTVPYSQEIHTDGSNAHAAMTDVMAAADTFLGFVPVNERRESQLSVASIASTENVSTVTVEQPQPSTVTTADNAVPTESEQTNINASAADTQQYLDSQSIVENTTDSAIVSNSPSDDASVVEHDTTMALISEQETCIINTTADVSVEASDVSVVSHVEEAVGHQDAVINDNDNVGDGERVDSEIQQSAEQDVHQDSTQTVGAEEPEIITTNITDDISVPVSGAPQSPLATPSVAPVTSTESPIVSNVTAPTITLPEMQVTPASPSSNAEALVSKTERHDTMPVRSSSFVVNTAHHQRSTVSYHSSTTSVFGAQRFAVRPMRNIAPPTIPDIPIRKHNDTNEPSSRKHSIESSQSRSPRQISPLSSPRQLQDAQQLPPELLLHRPSASQLPKSITLQQRAAYEIFLQLAQLREWIENILKVQLPQTFNFLAILRDGSILVQLFCALFPDRQPPQQTRRILPYTSMRNIAWLIREFKALGMKQVFQVEDLFEFKDIIGVVECLIEFSLLCMRRGKPGLRPLNNTEVPSTEMLKWMSGLIQGAV